MRTAEDNFSSPVTGQGSTALELSIINGGNDSPGTSNYAGYVKIGLDFNQQLVYARQLVYTSPSTFEDTSYIWQANVMQQQNSYSSTSNSKMVPLDSVIQGGSLIVGSVSVMSLLATILSGAVIIQPLFAIAILISCTGFYIMTLVKND